MKIRSALLQIRSILYVTILVLSHQTSIQPPSSNAIDQKPARVQTAPAPALVPGASGARNPEVQQAVAGRTAQEAEQRRHRAHTAAPTARAAGTSAARGTKRARRKQNPRPPCASPVSPRVSLSRSSFSLLRAKSSGTTPSGDAAALSPRARCPVACGGCLGVAARPRLRCLSMLGYVHAWCIVVRFSGGSLRQVEARAGVDGVEQLLAQQRLVAVVRQFEQVHARRGRGESRRVLPARVAHAEARLQ